MSPPKAAPAGSKQRLVSVTLDEESIGRSNEDVEHEREVAIYDLLEQNTFEPVGRAGGPYALHLEHRRQPSGLRHPPENGTLVMAHLFSLTPLRRIVKDYYLICDSYYQGDPHRDARQDRSDRHGPARAFTTMARNILMERLKGKVTSISTLRAGYSR